MKRLHVLSSTQKKKKKSAAKFCFSLASKRLFRIENFFSLNLKIHLNIFLPFPGKRIRALSYLCRCVYLANFSSLLATNASIVYAMGDPILNFIAFIVICMNYRHRNSKENSYLRNFPCYQLGAAMNSRFSQMIVFTEGHFLRRSVVVLWAKEWPSARNAKARTVPALLEARFCCLFCL